MSVRTQIISLLNNGLIKMNNSIGYETNVVKVKNVYDDFFQDNTLEKNSAIAFFYFGVETRGVESEVNYESEYSNLDLIVGFHFNVASNQDYMEVSEKIKTDFEIFTKAVYSDRTNETLLNFETIKEIESYSIREVSPVFYDIQSGRGEVFFLLSINYYLQ